MLVDLAAGKATDSIALQRSSLKGKHKLSVVANISRKEGL